MRSTHQYGRSTMDCPATLADALQQGQHRDTERLGVPLGPTQLLTLRGRTSGKPRSTPVTPLRSMKQRYVIGGFTQGDWVANARANGEAVLKQGRRTEHIRLIELPDAAHGPVMRPFRPRCRGCLLLPQDRCCRCADPGGFRERCRERGRISHRAALTDPRLRIKTPGVPQAAPHKGRHHRSPALNPSHGRLLERDTDEADSRVKEEPVRRLLLARAGSERIRDSEPQVSAPRLASREVPSGPWRIDRESVSSN